MEQVHTPGLPTHDLPDDGELDTDPFRKHPWLGAARSGLMWAAIAAALIYLAVVSTVRSKEQLQDVLTPEREEINIVSDLRAVGYDDKGKTWELFSKEATEDREGARKAMVKEVQVLNIYKEGRINISGVGDRGAWDKNQRQLELFDNVSLKDTDGTTTLVTNHLRWRDQTEELMCPNKVDMVIEDNHIVADSLFADRDLTHLRFLGNVRMYVKGLEKESLLTREGIVDRADMEPQGADDGKEEEGLWVAAQYLYYDKTTKTAICYPVVTAQVERDLGLHKVRAELDNTEGGRTADPIEHSLRKAKAWLESAEDQEAAEVDLLFGPSIPPALKERTGRQVLAWRHNKRLFSDVLEIDLTAKRLDPTGDALFYAVDLKDRVKENANKTAKAIAKETTSMRSDYMRYFWKTGLLEGWDGVDAIQKDKRLTARHLIYHEGIGIMECDGDVVIHQTSGDWMEREGLLDDVSEDKARKDAKKPTTIYSHAALLYDELGYLYCAGDVKIVQADQRAWSDVAEFYDHEQWVTLTGNVDYNNSKGEVVKSDVLTMFLHSEIYELFNAKKVTIEMPDKYARQIDEAREEDE